MKLNALNAERLVEDWFQGVLILFLRGKIGIKNHLFLIRRIKIKCDTCKNNNYYPGDTDKDYVDGVNDPYPYHYCTKLFWIGDEAMETIRNEDLDPYVDCLNYKKQG